MKRSIAALLAAGMMFTAVPGFAAESGDYEDIITKARICFDIPEDIEDIEVTGSEGGYGTPYRIEWTADDGTNYNISADKHGCITYYYCYDRTDETENVPADMKLSKEKAAEKAEKIFSDLYGENAAYLSKKSVRLSPSSINLTYVPVFNGLEVNTSVNLSINRISGRVESFDGVCGDVFKYDYTDPASVKLLDDDKRIESYKASNDLRLIYRTFKDYETGEEKTRPIYLFAGADINAVTGERLKDKVFYDRDALYANADASEEAADLEDDAVKMITENERKAIDKYNDYIKGDDADEIVKKYFPKLTLKPESSTTYISNDVPYTELRYSSVTEKPTYRYMWATAVLNAETGEIVMYSYYDSDEAETFYKGNGEAVKLDPEKAEKAARECFKKLAPKEYAEGKFDVNMNDSIYGNHLEFSRTENGIKVEYEGVEINLASDYTPNYYNKNWYDHDFPAVDGLLDEKTVYAEGSKDCVLKYILQMDDNGLTFPVLAYGNDHTVKCYDALTGERLSPYSGEIYEEIPEFGGEYTDIANSPYKKAIETLADYGYVLPYEKFEPDRNITVDEFYRLLDMTPAYKDKENDGYYYSTPLFTEAEGKNDMTKYQMTAIMLDLSSQGYYTKIAKEDIFKSSFDDVSAEYTGTVEIAAKIGLTAEKQGRFNGETKITRGFAAQYIYDYLSRIGAL